MEASARVLCKLDHALCQAHLPELFILVLLFILSIICDIVARGPFFALLFISFAIVVKHDFVLPSFITFRQQR